MLSQAIWSVRGPTSPVIMLFRLWILPSTSFEDMSFLNTLSFSALIRYLKGAAYVYGTFILSLLVKHVHRHRDTGL